MADFQILLFANKLAPLASWYTQLLPASLPSLSFFFSLSSTLSATLPVHSTLVFFPSINHNSLGDPAGVGVVIWTGIS